MFSTGQWIFAALFAVSFIVLMIFSYKKDKKLHKKHYKGSFLVLLGFFGFIILLVVMKIMLRQ